MFKRLLEKWRLAAEAVDGMDDPKGEYLFALEMRVRRLEDEVEALRTRRSMDAVASALTAAIAPIR